MSQEVETGKEETPVVDETVKAGSGAVPQEQTSPMAGGFLSEEEDENSYNRILPRALINGKGIPVTLSALPKLVEVGKDDKKFLAIRWEFYEEATQAYTKQNVAIPMEDVDVITEDDKKNQTASINQLKHLLGAFISYGDISGVKTYKEFVEKALERFKPEMKGTKAGIKLIYSSNNKFIQFPRFPNFISTTKKLKTLETDPSNIYDKIEKTKNAGGGAMTASDVDQDKMNDMI